MTVELFYAKATTKLFLVSLKNMCKNFNKAGKMIMEDIMDRMLRDCR